ncbi:Hypothetical predicted protein [Marmota monax]|uniref:Uncharacterized protein n=1 Tax=Marmota monax TaxID=9995 RepID=A0A5E4BR67_MARMO|nr:hypothetical protein GHT09_008871 [Marmota monax]VTJ72144.1 Hypothetical predicted protein [Marmota monax]
MSYWNSEQRSCVRYRRHFLVDNSVFHGELSAALMSAGLRLVSDSAFIPAF